MIGNPGHGDRFFFIPRRQRNIQNRGRSLRILKKHFIEIPHAEEEKTVRVLGFPLCILFQHGGHLHTIRKLHGSTSFVLQIILQ